MVHEESQIILSEVAAVSDPHPLDNPIWNALGAEHASFALKIGGARRYPQAIGPLSGMVDTSPASYEDLRSLAGHGGTIALFLEEPAVPPAGWTMVRDGLMVQMILPAAGDKVFETSSSGSDIRQLTSADVPAMVDLAHLTQPGPFQKRTSELGLFLGAFEGTRLIAMAGQRMHFPDYIEVSAVCTHPDARGRGLARILISKIVQDILDRGKTPILHAFANNYSAIRVYESLGFVLRRNLHLAFLKNEL
jgi:GNAT superfamily N-acetyltransferase